ncbi:hypothetical protein ACFFSW_16910 [Saccharothrix longispora]|uniref:Uncharacterized protein n=1 Tax=Saccharothrix longispora TaxID=33920 RepID=A0ABU1Q1T8_9PSEU|nr:hypothetical protein [Saccharothrix longispora]MDR6596349.1 hypothetical protein [Saccharothrix longispora]MDU0294579.1 hypothetical protein [Saccharothrix longispora]
MLFDWLLGVLVDIATTVLVLAALVTTCAALYSPRPPRGPRP